MRDRFPSLPRLLGCLCLLLLLTPPCAARAEAAVFETGPETVSEVSGETEAAPAPADYTADGEQTVYIGEIATRMEERWVGGVTFAVGGTSAKIYETMAGNVLRLTLYSTVPEGSGSSFYLPMDSHIQYIDGSDRFAMTGRSGSYYCYEKSVRVISGGTFELAVANTNGTLYSGLYDTIGIHAHDAIESLDFLAQQREEDTAVADFFVTVNGSETAIITPDTLGFNATDNEWKIVTADNAERVLFSDTVYEGYSFDPGTITLRITASERAQADPVAIQIYYLGLINGRLFTVGPYNYPASASQYSSDFMLARDQMDVLATESSVTVYAYIEAGRRPSLSVTEADGLVQLEKVETVPSDRSGLDRLAITLSILDTANDLDVLIGNRWAARGTAYNYHTLRLNFLRSIQSLSLTAEQLDHYHIVYTLTVNGQQELDTTAVNWYVNGVLQPEHGLVLDYAYDQGGSYAVYAELGGLQSNAVTSSIIYTDWQTAFWYAAALYLVAAAALLWWRRARNRGARVDAAVRMHLRVLLDHAAATQSAVQKKLLSPRRAFCRVARTWPQLDDLAEQLLDRHRATNAPSYQQAAQALDRARDRVRQANRAQADDPYYSHALLVAYQGDLRQALANLNEVAALTGR